VVTGSLTVLEAYLSVEREVWGVPSRASLQNINSTVVACYQDFQQPVTVHVRKSGRLYAAVAFALQSVSLTTVSSGGS